MDTYACLALGAACALTSVVRKVYGGMHRKIYIGAQGSEGKCLDTLHLKGIYPGRYRLDATCLDTRSLEAYALTLCVRKAHSLTLIVRKPYAMIGFVRTPFAFSSQSDRQREVVQYNVMSTMSMRVPTAKTIAGRTRRV